MLCANHSWCHWWLHHFKKMKKNINQCANKHCQNMWLTGHLPGTVKFRFRLESASEVKNRNCFGNYQNTRYAQWASYQIRKIAGCACAGNAGNLFPRRWIQRKPRVSDPGLHHCTCVTHVPWCMSGSLTRGCGENVPGIPSASAPAILRIW